VCVFVGVDAQAQRMLGSLCPAYNAPPYCHSRPVSLPPYISISSYKQHYFRKKILKKLFLLFYDFVWNIYHSKKNSATFCHKCENVFLQITCYSFLILTELEFSWQVFEKNLKYQVSSKCVQWEASCSIRTDKGTDGLKDGQTDMTKLIVTFRNFENAS
jgi:hypothetical protein